MPWTLSYSQDTEISGVGTATATFTDDAGKVLVSHSDRIDNRSAETINGFIDAALGKHAKAVKIETDTVKLLDKIQAVLTEKTK